MARRGGLLLIRRELLTATMRVYGAYSTAAIESLHAPKDGSSSRVSRPPSAARWTTPEQPFAPLRFGAGIKGKIVDAWMRGLPAVTTPVGAEGMVPGGTSCVPAGEGEGGRWRRGGRWTLTTAADIARDAVELHEDRTAWERARATGFELVEALTPAERNSVACDAIEGLFGASGEEVRHRARGVAAGGLHGSRAVASQREEHGVLQQVDRDEARETGGESGTPRRSSQRRRGDVRSRVVHSAQFVSSLSLKPSYNTNP